MSASANSVSIIVPTLNEEENIAPLVAQIVATAIPFREILFVDDHSTDATRDMIRAAAKGQPIRLIEQDVAGVGLAAAIMLGARAAHGDVLLVMDADLSHPPERIKELLAPLFAGTADLVLGSRYIKGGPPRVGPSGADSYHERERRLLIRSPAFTIQCAASLLLDALVC